ncbi:MerR family transcriptional regulator [Microbacterium sp.]|jgi:DNA-binding transcriptional MerR regulator|uniref:HEAT repeat domain-containing protein n=1 Tax=Microbacterium sp. TaxID=51671 RepID=UPI00263782C6|nr:MerR family transcriptional regulator [Microbacterium sp.]
MRIGEVSRLSGVSARMLRHYDRIGLVQPSERTSSGYRDYGDDDLRRLLQVEALRSLGMPLRQVGNALQDSGATPTDILDRVIAGTVEAIAREQELLRRLRQLRDHEPEHWTDVLHTVALLQRLGSDDASQRQRAALASAEPPIVSALIGAVLTEDDPNVAGALQWALARSADATAISALRDALDAGDGAVRHRAVATLVKIAASQRTDVDPVLRGALSHRDPVIRAGAALALGSRAVPEAADELIAMIVRGDGDVEAAESLGHISRAHPGTIEKRLDAALTTPGDPEARLRLTQALGEIDSEDATRMLQRLVEDPDNRVRLTARYLVSIREH